MTQAASYGGFSCMQMDANSGTLYVNRPPVSGNVYTYRLDISDPLDSIASAGSSHSIASASTPSLIRTNASEVVVSYGGSNSVEIIDGRDMSVLAEPFHPHYGGFQSIEYWGQTLYLSTGTIWDVGDLGNPMMISKVGSDYVAGAHVRGPMIFLYEGAITGYFMQP